MNTCIEKENSQETKDSVNQSKENSVVSTKKKVLLRKRRLSDPLGKYIYPPIASIDPFIQMVKSKLLEVDQHYNYKAYTIQNNFLNMHPRLNNVGYCNFIDWLIELSSVLGPRRDLAFNMVNIFNRYVSKIFDFDSKHLEKVGLCCLFIAAKADDTDSITTKELIKFSSNKLVKSEDYVNLEASILEILGYKLMYRSPLEFLFKIARLFNYTRFEEDAGWFILESTLIMPDSADISPYLMALIVTRLINTKIKNVAFDDRLFSICKCTKLRANQLTALIVNNLNSLQTDPAWQLVVHRLTKKFSAPEFSRVGKTSLF